MNLVWVDWVVIIIITLSGVISLWRGFVKECLSLLIWVSAAIVVWLFSSDVAGIFETWITSYSVRMIVAVILLTVAVLLAGTLIRVVISKLVDITGLSGSDRFFGMLFGLARGVTVVTMLTWLLVYMPVSQLSWWKNSTLLPKFENLAYQSKKIVTDHIAPLF